MKRKGKNYGVAWEMWSGGRCCRVNPCETVRCADSGMMRAVRVLGRMNGKVCPSVLSLFVCGPLGRHGDGRDVGNASGSHVGTLMVALGTAESATLHFVLW